MPRFVTMDTMEVQMSELVRLQPVPEDWESALVAREYGKPCVVGIDRAMTKLYDGQMVEVDGTAGVIRLLS